MTPNLRRACHQALDIVLDALAEDARGETKKRRPRPALVEAPSLPEGVTEADIARVDAKLARAGYRKKVA